MNWITTNIRFPEDLYLDLKLEAARNRTSVAQVIRNRITIKKAAPKRNVAKIMNDLRNLAQENARQNPGISFSEKLIQMRYEQ